MEDPLFRNGGELGRAMAERDWSRTAVGSPDTWPAALRNMVRIVLTSRFSMWVAWGPELTSFYNDAYRRDTLQAKHPWALGRPARGDVGGDLARHRPAHPVGAGDRRRHLGRGPAAVPGAQRLPRGDVPHVLLQPAGRRRRPHRRACSAWSPRTPSGSSASGGWRRCAISPRRSPAAGPSATCWPPSPSSSGRNLADLPFSARPTCSTTTAPRAWAPASPGSRRGRGGTGGRSPPTTRTRPGRWPGCAPASRSLVDDLDRPLPRPARPGAWQQPPDAGGRRAARLLGRRSTAR